MNILHRAFPLILLIGILDALAPSAVAGVGLGAKPQPGGDLLLDGRPGDVRCEVDVLDGAALWVGPADQMENCE